MNDEIDEILVTAFNDFYDYITERDIIKVAHEYSEKTVYRTAKQAINRLIAKARIEEIKMLDHRGFMPIGNGDFKYDVYQSDLDKRIATLEQSLKEQRNTSGRSD